MEYIKVLLPSLCVALLFWYVIRAIIRADSVERREMDRYYADLEDSERRGTESPEEASAAETGQADGESAAGAQEAGGHSPQ